MQLPIEWLPAAGAPEQLIVLLHDAPDAAHGAGQGGAAMASLAQRLRSAFPQAALLAPDAPTLTSTLMATLTPMLMPTPTPTPTPTLAPTLTPTLPSTPTGRTAPAAAGCRWFADAPGSSLSEADVAAALPPLWAWLREQQSRLGVPPGATALAGFGQGAVLALETAVRDDGLAGRVLAFGGRFAALPELAPRHTTLHLFHGGDDAVVPVRHARIALQRLARLQGDATLDVAKGAGHELHPALLECAVHRLTSHIPLRTWQAALGAAP